MKVSVDVHQASNSRTSQHAEFCMYILCLLVCIHRIDSWAVPVPGAWHKKKFFYTCHLDLRSTFHVIFENVKYSCLNPDCWEVKVVLISFKKKKGYIKNPHTNQTTIKCNKKWKNWLFQEWNYILSADVLSNARIYEKIQGPHRDRKAKTS